MADAIRQLMRALWQNALETQHKMSITSSDILGMLEDYTGKKVRTAELRRNMVNARSWVLYINNRAIKLTNQEQQHLSNAMRNAVKNQIRRERWRLNYPCALCGYRQAQEIDHVLKFRTLKNDFCDLWLSEGKQLPSVDNHGILFHQGKGCYLSHGEFRRRWQKYHGLNFIPRGVCRPCNVYLA